MGASCRPSTRSPCALVNSSGALAVAGTALGGGAWAAVVGAAWIFVAVAALVATATVATAVAGADCVAATAGTPVGACAVGAALGVVCAPHALVSRKTSKSNFRILTSYVLEFLPD